MVNGSATSPTSLIVRWGPVDCTQRNGKIIGYFVKHNKNTTTVVSTSGEVGEKTITRLSVSTLYSVSVAAMTSAGTGPYSDPITITTPGSKYALDYPQLSYSQVRYALGGVGAS